MSEKFEEMAERVERVLELPFCDRGQRLDLLLIALGEKQATSLIFPRERGDLEQIKSDIINAGFDCDWRIVASINPSNVELCVASSASMLTRIMSSLCDDSDAWGEFSGYPQTAIDAFALDSEDAFVPDSEIPADVRSQDYFQLLHFNLSRDHWRDELETVRRWYAVLQEYAPEFLRDYIDHKKAWRPWYVRELARQMDAEL